MIGSGPSLTDDLMILLAFHIILCYPLRSCTFDSFGENCRRMTNELTNSTILHQNGTKVCCSITTDNSTVCKNAQIEPFEAQDQDGTGILSNSLKLLSVQLLGEHGAIR